MADDATRRNPEMEKYVKIEPTVVEGCPGAHNVFLQVRNQRFTIGRFAGETKEEAEWTRDMFCISLAKVTQDAVEAERARCIAIVQSAREGEIDTDLRSIINRMGR